MRRTDFQYPNQFYRGLAFIYASGYPLVEGLRMLADGMPCHHDNLLCRKIMDDLLRGRSLVKAFRDNGFPDTLVSSLKAGEQSGRLEETLQWYADFAERNLAIERNLKQSLLQPVVTLAFSLLLAVLLPPLVLRDQLSNLAALGADMPLVSRMLLWFSGALTHPLFWTTLLLSGTLLWKAWKRLPPESAEGILCELPLLGEIRKRVACARGLSLLGLLLRAGAVPSVALPVAGKGSGSVLFRAHMKSALKELTDGASFSEALRKCDWFSACSKHLLETGEAVGDMGRLATMAANLEEEKFREQLEQLAAALQPLVLILVGAFVCLTLIAVLGPTLSLMSNL